MGACQWSITGAFVNLYQRHIAAALGREMWALSHLMGARPDGAVQRRRIYSTKCAETPRRDDPICLRLRRFSP